MKNAQKIGLSLIALFVLVILIGCSNRTKISDILGNTNKFMNHDVLVGGKIVNTYAVNLIIAEAGVYQIDDGTGKIWVITKNGVPEQGRTVDLKGTVSSGMRIGGESFGAVLREIERKTK